MGTIARQYTFVAGAIPTASQWNSDPDNFITLVNGNLDESNVDTAGADGIVGISVEQTTSNGNPITGDKTFSGNIDFSGGWQKPIIISTVRMWYDTTTSVLRVKHGSDPSTEVDGNILMEG